MNQSKKIIQAAAGIFSLLLVVAAVTSCSKSSTSGGTAISKSGGMSGAGLALAKLIGVGGGAAAGVLHPGGLQPAASLSINTTIQCPGASGSSSPGSQSLSPYNNPLAENYETSSSFTLVGTLLDNLTNCVNGSDTFSGYWVEAFNVGDAFYSSSGPSISFATSVVMTGSININNYSTANLSINGVNCNQTSPTISTMSFTVSLTNVTFPLSTNSTAATGGNPTSGTIGYGGILCGANVAGSCTYTNGSPSCTITQ